MNLSKSAIKNQQIRQRVIDIANYIIENNATVRDVANLIFLKVLLIWMLLFDCKK